MEVVANNYLPGDQRLVDKIVYELKAQGIFDQFRKECFADVDTKPAYQNLRQRVEGSVSGFLKEQSWRPDMNKNQVREMLRKKITESGYLETGVERIVDQVVNPKINTVFLPKVEEVVYSYLGIKKPSKGDQSDLLPNDLEAVSPEPIDKNDEKSVENQGVDETKIEEDESPPFEPLDEQMVYVPQEENSVDSHLSGFSGLISHESNQSNENKVSQVEQDSQMSRNSSDSRLSIVTSDENSKMDVCEDSQSKSIKSNDSNHKHKSSERHKSRSESKSDKDRKSGSSKSRHSSSSKDSKDKSRDRKDSKSSSSASKYDKDKPRDKDRGKTSTISKHASSSSSSSGSKDKSLKKEPSNKDKDKPRSSSHKDSKPREKSSDSKLKDKSSSSDKHKHSSSHSDKHKKDKDRKKSKDDHYSSKDKKNDRRSTDRDSNDGQSTKSSVPGGLTENSNSSQTQKPQESSQSAGDSGNSEQVESTKAPINITSSVENSEVTIRSPETQRVKVLKPKCASNIQEALKLMKIRKQLAKLEKHNRLSLASVDVNSPLIRSSSIDLDQLGQKHENKKNKQEHVNSKIVAELEVVPSPLQNTVISQDNWDAMEAKLRQEVCSEFKEYDSVDESPEKVTVKNVGETCKYFDRVELGEIEYLIFVKQFIKQIEEKYKKSKAKRKSEDSDVKNNNNKKTVIPEKKRRIVKKNKELNSHNDISDKFSLPLSPAESDKSVDKKFDHIVPLKPKRNSINKASNQRYSSDDLYKPRPTFASSRRRGAKNLEN